MDLFSAILYAWSFSMQAFINIANSRGQCIVECTTNAGQKNTDFSGGVLSKFSPKSLRSLLVLSFFPVFRLIFPKNPVSSNSLAPCGFAGTKALHQATLAAFCSSKTRAYFRLFSSKIHIEDNTRNQVVSQEARGFESHPVRHLFFPLKMPLAKKPVASSVSGLLKARKNDCFSKDAKAP